MAAIEAKHSSTWGINNDRIRLSASSCAECLAACSLAIPARSEDKCDEKRYGCAAVSGRHGSSAMVYGGGKSSESYPLLISTVFWML